MVARWDSDAVAWWAAWWEFWRAVWWGVFLVDVLADLKEFVKVAD